MKLQPSEFWSLSLVEWRWLLGGADKDALNVRDLQHLMAQFPDEKL